MIIDSHMHVGTIDDLDMPDYLVIPAMERYGIAFGLLSNIEGGEFGKYGRIPDNLQKNQREANDRVLELVLHNPSALAGQFWIRPALEGYAPWIEQYLRTNSSYFCAIKFHQFRANMNITHENLIPYINLAERLSLPFVVHTATDEFSAPEFVLEAARRNPGVNFILVHMGLGTDNGMAIECIRSLPNIYGDTTWVSPESVLRAIGECGSEKIIFGTDSPIDGIDTYSKYSDLLTRLDSIAPHDRENVLFNNSIRLFNLAIPGV